MNFAQIRAFHAVAEEGGFTAAAHRLGLTQPAVTVQVKALEARYQVELFHRRARRIVLTPVGEELHRITRRLMMLEREADEFLEAEGGLERGRLGIAADGPFHILSLIQAIRDKMPGLRITVAIGNSRTVRQALLDYDALIGVLSEYQADDRFTVLSSNRHAVMLMIPADHGWAGRASVDIAELQDVPMVLREKGSSTRLRFEEALREAGIDPRIVLEIGSRESVREAVAANLGLGVIQEPEFGSNPRIAKAAIGGVEITAGEYIICLAERRDSRILATLEPLLGNAPSPG
ncbi:MAG: LysR substrate-binding domain-containing protein [Alphaproteobacteria bacterium]|nr:LysR substrate-binding domain-containing protein [Alphaproteobacteria bacterium]